MDFALYKKLAALASAASIGVPSSYGIYKIFDKKPGTNISVPLLNKADFRTKYKKGTFGNKYGAFLKDASEEADWLFWDNQLNKFKASSPLPSDNVFASSISSGDELRRKCDDIYSKESSWEGTTTNGSITLLNAWKACTELPEKPEIRNESNSNKPLVAEFDQEKNLTFWEIRDKQFKEKDGYSLDIENINSYQWFKNKKNTESTKTIKELCKTAFEMTHWTSSDVSSSSQTQPTKQEVKEYCYIW